MWYNITMQQEIKNASVVQRIAYGMLVVAALCTASLLIMAVTWLQGLPIGGILFVPYLLVVVGSGGSSLHIASIVRGVQLAL